ncbi:TatD family hydrolase [Halopseudomonas pelagia]|uniref:TatD family hydrolase n=1 Tax=Halopseudomonas pelagia TaxID=553151 RepID=UPI0003A99632|nr:TatD family hydrolase [Halopseudomonas pelagia]|tara:strand:- start:735 stop:1529 length:795 start_codon:yes stop_codon:yes gene_type:complete
MRYIDTHTHLDFPEFDSDRQQVLTRCAAAGVDRLVILGVFRENWDRLWRMVAADNRLFAAFGLHPIYLAQHQQQHLHDLAEYLERLAAHPQCCAVGEIGLDYFLPELNRERQQRLFCAQLSLAADANLPVLLHVRRAHADTIAILKRYRLPRAGIVHAFAGSLEEAQEYIRLGFKLGLGGAATWPQAKKLHRTVAALPLDSLVLETDSPDMAPSFHAYQRNSPEYLPQICLALAALRGESAEILASACLHNSCEIFDWSSTTLI